MSIFALLLERPYASLMALRNSLYDAGVFRQWQPPVPTVAIGNLSTGGTGKTPMALMVAQMLMDEGLRVAILSRGYGRKTKGFLPVSADKGAEDVGDEPLLLKRLLPQAIVAVCENRRTGIKKLLALPQPPEAVVLDDAFQHRRVKARYYMLLTTWEHPFVDDMVLPAGNLRELPSGAKRAHVVVVTKSPPKAPLKEKKALAARLAAFEGQPVLFASLRYGNPYNAFHPGRKATLAKRLLVFTGVAQPEHLVHHLKSAGHELLVKTFPDHHRFSHSELQDIASKAKEERMPALTTEKDLARLSAPQLSLFAECGLFVQPVRHHLPPEDASFLEDAILRACSR